MIVGELDSQLVADLVAVQPLAKYSRGNEEISLPGRNFKWPKHKVKALGVWLSVDPEATATLNYKEKLVKIRNILSSWKYRRLTLIGKIAVLKSLVASQLVYVLSLHAQTRKPSKK